MKKNRVIRVETTDMKQAKAIEFALQDPAFRATAILVGVLKPLSKDEQNRIMAYVWDRFIDHPESDSTKGE